MKKILFLLITCNLAYAGDIDVAFSPKQGGQELIIKAINSANKSICMATYSFTSKPISEAIMKAKQRGVAIQVVSDAKANGGKYTATRYLANHGVDVRLNSKYAIMHNKFMVIDNKTVQTGSYNYSEAANSKNAENVIVIWDDSALASKYNQQCQTLFNQGDKLEKSY